VTLGNDSARSGIAARWLLCLKRGRTGADPEYLSVKLDDPSFPAPIYASLVKGEGDDACTLIWSRRNGD